MIDKFSNTVYEIDAMMKAKPHKVCPKHGCFLIPRKKYRRVGSRQIYTGFTTYVCRRCDQELK